jgi:hypothetical protein
VVRSDQHRTVAVHGRGHCHRHRRRDRRAELVRGTSWHWVVAPMRSTGRSGWPRSTRSIRTCGSTASTTTCRWAESRVSRSLRVPPRRRSTGGNPADLVSLAAIFAGSFKIGGVTVWNTVIYWFAFGAFSCRKSRARPGSTRGETTPNRTRRDQRRRHSRSRFASCRRGRTGRRCAVAPRRLRSHEHTVAVAVAAEDEDVAGTILATAEHAEAALLVIGARPAHPWAST